MGENPHAATCECLVAFLGMSVASVALAGDLTLAENGQARVAIVVASNAIPAERTAARELAHYLKKATGADFVALDEDRDQGKGAAVHVGPTRVARDSGVDIAGLGPEEFVIRTVGSNLVLAGGRPRGTLYAVYAFLEDVVGVRWWTLQEEHVPRRTTLTVPDQNRREKPAFQFRDIYGIRYFGDKWPFLARNRTNGRTFKRRGDLPLEYGGHVAQIARGHSTVKYISPAKHCDHPEWFASQKGKRKTADELKAARPTSMELCYSNREMRRELIRLVLQDIATEKEKLARNPAAVQPESFSMWQMDNRIVCDCAVCRAICEREGTDGAAFWNFVNELAAAVAKEHPRLMLETVAYKWTQRPPRNMRLRENVIVMFAPIGLSMAEPLAAQSDPKAKQTYQDLLNWRKRCHHLRTWLYVSPFTQYSGLPLPTLFNFRDDLRTVHRLGLEGVHYHCLGRVNHDQPEMNPWIAAKLLWNPHRDWEALFRDFTDGYYGAAGQHLRSYFELLDRAAREHPSYVMWKSGLYAYRYLTADFIIRAQRIFDRANAAVADDPKRLERVCAARLPLDRATLSLWSDFAPQFGGMDKEQVLDRFLNGWDRFLEKRYPLTGKSLEKWRHYWKEHHVRLKRWRTIVTHAKPFDRLPVEFPDRGIPNTSVRPEAIVGHRIVRVAPDPESPGGVAVVVQTAKLPVTGGIYDLALRQHRSKLSLTKENIKGDGYHAYQLGVLRKGDRVNVWVLGWKVMFYDPNIRWKASADREWNVYLSARFTGPAYLSADSREPNAVYIDRLILVPRESRKK